MLQKFFPYAYADNVYAIDYRKLWESGIKAVVFDIDNTLVHHGDKITRQVLSLFQRLQRLGMKILLLSNNGENRIRAFTEGLNIPHICNAEKPNPECYFSALKILNVTKDEAVFIGDQMFVDIVGANNAGVKSILVHFIPQEGEKYLGIKRYIEFILVAVYRRSKYNNRLDKATYPKPRRLFCEISPMTYAISKQKETLRRSLANLKDRTQFAQGKQTEELPVTLYEKSLNLIKRGPGIDESLQKNKAINIRLACEQINGLLIQPGETFSMWDTVGKPSKARGYKKGRIIGERGVGAGMAGGLCNLGNTLHLMVLASPMKVTEYHTHSDALDPDTSAERIPLNSGTSVCYNYLDFRCKNETEYTFQLCTRVENETLFAMLKCDMQLPYRYELVEEDHHFENNCGTYYRYSKVYRLTISKESEEIVNKELVFKNRSKVMYDPELIIPELIRDPEF